MVHANIPAATTTGVAWTVPLGAVTLLLAGSREHPACEGWLRAHSTLHACPANRNDFCGTEACDTGSPSRGHGAATDSVWTALSWDPHCARQDHRASLAVAHSRWRRAVGLRQPAQPCSCCWGWRCCRTAPGRRWVAADRACRHPLPPVLSANPAPLPGTKTHTVDWSFWVGLSDGIHGNITIFAGDTVRWVWANDESTPRAEQSAGARATSLARRCQHTMVALGAVCN